jgi:hypothetical protein
VALSVARARIPWTSSLAHLGCALHPGSLDCGVSGTGAVCVRVVEEGLVPGLDMDRDSEICSSCGRTRLPSLTLGAQLRNPLTMHSGASDKKVHWLRRCVPRVPLSAAILTCDSRGSSSVGGTLAEEGEFICNQWDPQRN